MIDFQIVDPSRRTGSEHRQFPAGFQSVDKLGAFFHDRQVGREVGIDDLVDAEFLERGEHLTFDVRADLIAKLFADGGADRRSDLRDNDFFRVANGAFEDFDVVFFTNGAGRARLNAFAAIDASGIFELVE